MDSSKEIELQSKRNDALINNNAQTIFDNLKKLVNLGGNNKRRWLWELLQNAKDSANAGDMVNVSIEIDDSSVSFLHDGMPFRDEEVIHLIYHGSTKKDLRDKTGKFGTGFLTTHLLAKKVLVTGMMTDDQEFSVTIDRSGEDIQQIRNGMDSAWNEFKNSKKSNSKSLIADKFTTRFSYTLEEDGKENALSVLEDLDLLMPFVLVFTNNIKSIHIKSPENQVEFKYINNKQLKDDSKTLLHSIEKTRDGELETKFGVLSYSTESMMFGCLVDFVNDSISISDRNKYIPKLFYDFPLLGTTEIPFTLAINSLRFFPKEERDGIFLGEENTLEIKQNKDLIEQAFKLLTEFISFSSGVNILNVHRLININFEFKNDWIDRTWMLSVLQNFFNDDLQNIDLVRTENDSLISIDQAIFPISGNYEIIWELLLPLFGNKLPQKSSLKEWFNIINQMMDLFSTSHKENDDFFDLTKIAYLIQSKKNIDNLKNNFLNEKTSSEEVLAWLNKYYSTLTELKQIDLIQNNSLFPNQNGLFCTAKLLWRDKDISEELKNILKEFEIDLRLVLLNKSVTCDYEGIITKSQVEILDSLINKFKDLKFILRFFDGYNKFIIWLIDFGQKEYFENLWYVSEKKDDKNSSIPKQLNFQSRVLVPVEFINTNSSEINELLPKELVISADYHKEISLEKFKLLEKIGFVHSELIVSESVNLEKDVIQNLLDDEEKKSFDSSKEHSAENISMNKIVFLDTPDKGIIDNARQSRKKSSLFLKLLLTELIINDTSWNRTISINCKCGLNHNIYSALWLNTLKKRSWIFYDGVSEKPSAENLYKYFLEDETLSSILANAITLDFLEKLGVSTTDLFKSLNVTDTKMKQEYDKLFIQIISKEIDPNNLRMLLDEPDIISEIKERNRQREIVKRNQDLGSLVENLFKEIFEEPENIERGFSISRTSIGSDFEIEFDVVSDKREQLLEIVSGTRKVLVEIKSTRTKIVRMTDRQGKTSVENKNNFALCVVQITDEGLSKDFVKANAIFITNIGDEIKEKVDDVVQLREFERDIRFPPGDVEVDITDSQVRYIIKDSLWQTGINFEKFIDYCKK